jgi:hypothetical protein
MEAADSPEAVISASMIRVCSAVKQKEKIETSLNCSEIQDT